MAAVMNTVRRSDVAYVAVKLEVEGRYYWLLRIHEKWGDWSLVGGHVEPDERSDWLRAACRETDEELAPLRCGRDLEIRPLSSREYVWGPEESISAGRALTEYHARLYYLTFLGSPAELLSRLPSNEFLLVEEERVATHADADISRVVRRVRDLMVHSVPVAGRIDRSEVLGISKRPPTHAS